MAARKISFNGLKETIVLPQQAGKSLELFLLLLLSYFLKTYSLGYIRYSSEGCNMKCYKHFDVSVARVISVLDYSLVSLFAEELLNTSSSPSFWHLLI